jgi:hypothetical protein
MSEAPTLSQILKNYLSSDSALISVHEIALLENLIANPALPSLENALKEILAGTSLLSGTLTLADVPRIVSILASLYGAKDMVDTVYSDRDTFYLLVKVVADSIIDRFLEKDPTLKLEIESAVNGSINLLKTSIAEMTVVKASCWTCLSRLCVRTQTKNKSKTSLSASASAPVPVADTGSNEIPNQK